MSGSPPQTDLWSAHFFRRNAREMERRLQATLALTDPVERRRLGIPIWAHGVRTRRVGLRLHKAKPVQYVVELTSWRGH